MSNTNLSPAIPTLISNFQAVLRQQIGFILKTTTDFDDKGAALGVSVTVPIAGDASTSNVVPGVNSSQGTSSDLGEINHVLNQYKKSTFFLTQEEAASLRENREGFQSTKIMKAMSALLNDIETDIGLTAVNASRSVGAGGVTPFGSNHNVLAELAQIFDDNGASQLGRQFVMDSNAKVNLGQLVTLTDASALGSDSMVRDGVIGRLGGFDLGYSAGVSSAVKGTGTGYVINNGDVAIGSTSITVDTGSGTVLAGDVIKFENDARFYVVTTGITAPGTLVIAAPGLQEAIVDGDTVTVQTNGVKNYAFMQESIAVSVRPPIRQDKDEADEVILISDPESGLTFEMAHYPQYRQGTWEMSAVWGVTNVNPASTAILLG